jgi:hypothetical protein
MARHGSGFCQIVPGTLNGSGDPISGADAILTAVLSHMTVAFERRGNEVQPCTA